MATIVEKAAKGQRKAMECLYEKNKKKIFYIAKNLLLDENQAADALVWIFKNLWSASFAPKMTTEEEFTKEAVRMTAEYCKKLVLKRDAKAFRTPQNKNFQIADTGTYDGLESYEAFVLRKFSSLQRFIFVLHTLCKYDNEQIAETLKLSSDILPIALEAQKSNIEKILEATENHENYTCESLIDVFLKKEENAVVPEKADKQVLSEMDRIAEPAEKKKKTVTMIAGITSAVCLCIVAGLVFIFGSGQGNTDQGENAAEIGTESAEHTASSACYADIEIQDYGLITVELDKESAPITTENFISLAKSGFYNGLTFHRIMEGFMMQGGDPEGTGMGGSENTIVGEFSENGYDNSLSHTRGAISMARSSDYDSASSQFFIVHEDSTFLDGEYAVFGYVTEGIDIVDEICESAEPTDGNGTIPADMQPVITSITIRTE